MLRLALSRGRAAALAAIVVAIGAGLVLTTAGAQADTPARAAYVRDCSLRVDFNLKIIRVRNMTCGAAGRVARRIGTVSRRFHVSGFYCYRISGGPLGGVWRCVRSPQAFRFEFGD